MSDEHEELMRELRAALERGEEADRKKPELQATPVVLASVLTALAPSGLPLQEASTVNRGLATSSSSPAQPATAPLPSLNPDLPSPAASVARSPPASSSHAPPELKLPGVTLSRYVRPHSFRYQQRFSIFDSYTNRFGEYFSGNFCSAAAVVVIALCSISPYSGYSDLGYFGVEAQKPTAVLSPEKESPDKKREDIAGYYNRGIAKYKLGQFENAIADLDKVIELKPDDAAAYHDRGVAKHWLGQFEKAIADYDKAIELDPKDAMSHYSRGMTKSEFGKLEDAIADYDKAIELKPDYAMVYHNRGITKYKLGQFENAIADLDKLIELKPDYAAAYHDRGCAKHKLGKLEEAEADFNRASELEKKSKEAQK